MPAVEFMYDTDAFGPLRVLARVTAIGAGYEVHIGHAWAQDADGRDIADVAGEGDRDTWDRVEECALGTYLRDFRGECALEYDREEA